MMLGGVGWMAGPACVIPRESVRLYELCCQQKWNEALELQKQLWSMNQVFQKYNLAACIKECLNQQGFSVGAPLFPSTPLSYSAQQEIRNAWEAICKS